MELTFSRLNSVSVNFEESKGISRNVTVEKTANGYKLLSIVKNSTNKCIELGELATVITGLKFGFDSRDDYFYANENARIYGTLTIPVDYDRVNDDAEINKHYGFVLDKKWADPDVVCKRICAAPYQPLHAVLVSNYSSKNGLCVGSLCEDVFTHSFELSHDTDGAIVLKIISSFKDVAYRELAAGEIIKDEFYIGEELAADDINNVFSGYVAELYKILKDNKGATKTNRHTLIWDSWNDGIYRDISEKMLLNEAKAVKKHFPNVEWFQMDDGYSAYCEADVDLDAHGLGVPYEGADGIDKNKFPHGLRHYTDEVKKLGLKPAIWIGGLCPKKAKIYREHSEWFIDYSYRLDNTSPLDISLQQARDYVCYALDKFISEYGFEGIKHDFWSYAFEDRHDILRYKNKSGYEWRTWLLQEFRKRLPEYGYVETGCDISMGDPFIGKYFNNYRFGLDVGAGKWSNIKTVAFWAVAILSAHTGGLFVPNSDSIGLLPGLDDDDFQFIVNFQVITRTLVEISGKFSTVGENKRLKILQKATKYLNNGESVFFAKYDYRQFVETLPEIIYIKSFFDTPNLSSEKDIRTVGIFNAAEADKEILFTARDIDLTDGEYIFEDVWSGQKCKGAEYKTTLRPHGSTLVKVYKC